MCGRGRTDVPTPSAVVQNIRKMVNCSCCANRGFCKVKRSTTRVWLQTVWSGKVKILIQTFRPPGLCYLPITLSRLLPPSSSPLIQSLSVPHDATIAVIVVNSSSSSKSRCCTNSSALLQFSYDNNTDCNN
ncbi:hypothetical protein F2P81_024985 [Scophthalmus maximus]|uniref:Uncharacterized protein n=1 Tax=Scophthalmus maximus TaxID=52904 RepID=A0A6A4RX23_SCOMX|nr:hypothetical protein F2P81_024985 [Scophthalmus maximus]